MKHGPRRWSADPRKTSVPRIPAHRCVRSRPQHRGGLHAPTGPRTATGRRRGGTGRARCPGSAQQRAGAHASGRAAWKALPSETEAFCSSVTRAQQRAPLRWVSGAGYSTGLASHGLKSGGSRQLRSHLRWPWRPGRGPRLLPPVPTQGPRTSTAGRGGPRLPCPLGGPLLPRSQDQLVRLNRAPGPQEGRAGAPEADLPCLLATRGQSRRERAVQQKPWTPQGLGPKSRPATPRTLSQPQREELPRHLPAPTPKPTPLPAQGRCPRPERGCGRRGAGGSGEGSQERAERRSEGRERLEGMKPTVSCAVFSWRVFACY